jgi:hypothetical protein
MFSFTRFYLRVLADLNEIIRRLKRNVILTIAIEFMETTTCEVFRISSLKYKNNK